ncbi:MAG: DUF177 domain-containing protein [Burkholderiales bacterium]|nr:DUF177 domain-containing protein [Burkholderiales bacterium]MDE2453660.1 DUF177 domain-containing protein [Burkholderiales bacterium]
MTSSRPRPLDPRKLDVRAFAAAAGSLSGETTQSDLPRLAASVLALADTPPAPVQWSVQGALRPVTGGAPVVALQLQAHTTVALQCQRCLRPLQEAIEIDRRFRFVGDEDEAARLDEEDDDEDVLVASRAFDLLGLVEDELILALPIVPRHAECPQPLPLAAADEAGEAAPNPFAALAALRRPPSGD